MSTSSKVKEGSDFIPVVFQSNWEEGLIETNAEFNVKTGEIDNIESSDGGEDFESLIEQKIISMDGSYEAVVDEEHGDFDYWASPEDFFGISQENKEIKKVSSGKKPKIGI